MTLTFAENSHRYRLDGKHVTGVTTLIKGGLPAPALLKWAPRVVAEFVADNEDRVADLRAMGRGPLVAALRETPWAERDAAAGRGTEVHDLAEKLLHGEQVDVPDAIAGHVESCVAFLDDTGLEPLLVEAVVGHRAHWWAGKLDCIGRLPNGRTILLDWKTTRSGIFAEAAIQLSAYRHAEFFVCPWSDSDQQLTTLCSGLHQGQYAEHEMPAVDEVWGVHLRADGYSIRPVDASPTTYNAFRHIKWVAEFARDRCPGLVADELRLPRPVSTSEEVPA